MVGSVTRLSTLLVLCFVALAVIARATAVVHHQLPATTEAGGKDASNVLSNASSPQSLLTASAGTSPEKHHSVLSPSSSLSSRERFQHRRSPSSILLADDERGMSSSPTSTMTSISRPSSPIKEALPQRSASNMRSSIASGHLRAANRHTGNTLGRALISAPVGLCGVGVSLYGTVCETAHGNFAKAGGHLTDAVVYKPAATLAMMTGGTLSSCKDVGWQLCKSLWHLGGKASDGVSLRMARKKNGGESTQERTERRERQAVKADKSNAKSALDADKARTYTGNVWRSMLSTKRFPDAYRQNMARGKTVDRSSSSLPLSAPLVNHVHSS